MKRILTLLTLCFFLFQAQAQVLFNQDFQSGSLDPMIAIDVDGKTLAPQIANLAGPTWKVVAGDGDNLLVVSTSWFQPFGKADDWLISDTLRVTEPNTFLVWDAYSPDPDYRDGYEVRSSITTKEVASFTNVLLTIPQELTTTQTRALNLDAFIGQDMFFAFRNNSNDKFLLYLDNIRVETLKENDARVTRVNFEKYQPVGAVVPVTITIENHGALPLTSLVFSYTLGTETFTDTITGMNVAPLKTTEITHNVDVELTEPGAFPVEVSISYPNGVEDGNPADNTGSKFIYSLSEQLPKKVVVEEGTGTWCTWCPRGAVYMDSLSKVYSEIALPIAVHNGDPMAITEYDGPFSSTLSGYPSGHVDRKVIDTDPLNFLSAIQTVQNRIVPAGIEVTTDYDEETRVVTFTATGFLSIATTLNDLRFSAVITEDSVTGTSPGYDQINAYSGGAVPMGGYENLPNPVPASMMVYDFVARALIGDFNGIAESIPDTLEAYEEFTMEFSYEVPDEFEPEHMKAIVFILDEETGEILNGDSENLLGTTTSIPLLPLGKSVVYPNPASDVINISVDFQTTDPVSMTIYDTYGRMISNVGNLDLSKGSKVETINVSDIPSGSYILELRHKNAVTALPFNKI